ncbi:flagellar motor switch protein FliG [Ferrovum sp.]|jgi:flagellar motor switch protein FliG|uniref:flagellar motor switch protein FliG n=1 Tax=Ferrovum sp. TaxID=2609467 RepID=UPI002626F951|nr:flagellar motor switch protein FliG [Ferrovum sp.]
MSDEGVSKCAVFLMSLGESEAAEVLKQLSPKEVQKISTAMASMKPLTKEQISTVFDEFHQLAGERTSVGSNSSDYIKKMLNQALGDDKAAGLIERILHGGDTSGIESLKWMDAVGIAELISNEHPQIIATILAHLEPDQCAGVLNALTERTRNDVILRIATLDGVQPLALRELNDVLTKLLMGSATTKKRIKGGTKATAEILNYVGGATEASVIEAMRAYDPELAQKILDEMFVFDNIMDIDDRGIQLILREIQSESLIVALKGASPELREKIFKNMSQRAAEMMREDLDAKGPVRVSDVEAEQKEIIKVIRRMADEGQIALGGKGDDAFV